MDNAVFAIEGLLRALADATRLRILGLLLTGEVCVCHIHESLRIPQPKASRHLAYLRRAGLVETRREGLWVYYRLARVPHPVLGTIREAVTHALGHVESIRRDSERLRKKTGCCLPAAEGLSLACCEGAGAVRIATARSEDLGAVVQVLERNGLPTAGLSDHWQTVIVAREEDRVVGSAALELYPDGALLRSVAVDPSMRGRGLGSGLVARALDVARARGVGSIYLLTTTAERFFPRFGFGAITRAEVPASVQTSVEFTSACPASAVVMRKELPLT